MDMEKFTERARAVIQAAQTQAVASGHQQFTVEHLFLELLQEKDGLINHLLSLCGVEGAVVQREVEAQLATLPKLSGGGAGQLYLSSEIAQLFTEAQKNAAAAGDSLFRWNACLKQ